MSYLYYWYDLVNGWIFGNFFIMGREKGFLNSYDLWNSILFFYVYNCVFLNLLKCLLILMINLSISVGSIRWDWIIDGVI